MIAFFILVLLSTAQAATENILSCDGSRSVSTEVQCRLRGRGGSYSSELGREKDLSLCEARMEDGSLMQKRYELSGALTLEESQRRFVAFLGSQIGDCEGANQCQIFLSRDPELRELAPGLSDNGLLASNEVFGLGRAYARRGSDLLSFDLSENRDVLRLKGNRTFTIERSGAASERRVILTDSAGRSSIELRFINGRCFPWVRRNASGSERSFDLAACTGDQCDDIPYWLVYRSLNQDGDRGSTQSAQRK